MFLHGPEFEYDSINLNVRKGFNSIIKGGFSFHTGDAETRRKVAIFQIGFSKFALLQN
jgi:hypothetical protein